MATPTSNMVPTQTYSLSGQSEIDAVLYGLSRWGNGGLGTSVSLTYSFAPDIPTSDLGLWWKPSYGGDNEEIYAYRGTLDEPQRDAAHSALQGWSNVANITFNEVAVDLQITVTVS